ncbi:B3 domain-containing protein At5g26805-like isoform X1 [Vigna unguiculata]|nr:B3 domain-containing protein At5g26805-like isoform X1 [Vigna unguiculata]
MTPLFIAFRNLQSEARNIERETRTMFGTKEETDETMGNENDSRREREREQQNLLVGRQSVLMEQQNILMAQQNILTEQQNVLMAQQSILMGQQKILTEQQNALVAQQKIHTEQQNVADEQQKVEEHTEQQNSSSADHHAMEQSSSEEDPWKIKKVLQDFDLTLRLLVAPSLARNFMLPVLNATDYEIEKGFDVEIWDVDTHTKHSLFFTKKSHAYILVDNWINDFVHRRALHRGDEIGLCWDPTRKCFNFSVLRRPQT